jgi:nitroreductase
MNEVLKTICSLRTIHGNFLEREVSESDLKLVLEASVRAANASGRQSYSIVVLDDRKMMQGLFGYQGSRALIFCVDFNRIMATARHLGHTFDGDNIIGFITGTIDTILAVQTAVMAAKSLGIDSLITTGLHRNNLDKVYQALNLPEKSCFPLVTVVLGYPNGGPVHGHAALDRRHKKGRLSLEFVVHRGRYTVPDKSALDRIVAEYDDHQRHIGLIDNWEKLGFKHYLDWFYTKWSGKPPKDRTPSGKILEFEERLTKSGFWWPMILGEK